MCVPQMSHNDLQKGRSKAHDAHYALAFSPSVFASVENKRSLGYIPKLKVASSSLVARSKSLSKTGKFDRGENQNDPFLEIRDPIRPPANPPLMCRACLTAASR
jgi:hypothetical protein